LLQSAAAYRERFDSALEMTFHEVSGETHAALGQARDAFHDFAVASHLAAAVGTSELIAQVENNFALVASDLGEFDLATQRHRIALTEARRTSMPWRVAYCALNYAHTLTLRGDLTAARSLVWEALDSGVTTATFFTKVAAVGIPLALLLNDRQLLDACARDEALSFAARSKETQRIASVAAAFADWKTAIGSPGEARAVVRDAREHIGRPHRCTTLFLHIAAAGTADDRRWARATLPASGVRPRMRRACNVLLLAADFAASGDRAQAKRFGAAAARAFSRLGMPLHEARALELSDCAAAALERYAAMGNVRDTERLRQRSQTPATGVALSARQLEVARLVAQGQTNRAIASRLHISEHTVEHHLSTIFERLGLHSRSALAAKIGDVPTPT
jgi:DNA-binding CsgD family transcriptional regulator